MSDLVLTLTRLRAANLQRLPLFKNRRGEPAHSQPDGSDWPLDEWTNAVAGEVGESCNLAKKLVRGDFGPHGSPEYMAACGELAHELADIVIYADITSFRAGNELATDVAALCADEERDPKAARIAGLTNRIAAKAGTACSIADDLRPGRSQYTGLQTEELQKLLCKWLAAAVLTAETACVAADRDLSEAIIEKFNIVSDRVGCQVKL